MNLGHTLRTTIAAFSTVLIAGAPAAFAASVNVGGINTITGPNSLNTHSFSINDTASQWVNNIATALNSLQLELENGENDVENNTTVASFSSGDVVFGGAFTTHLNNTPTIAAGAGSPLTVLGSFGNGTTGPNSINTNALDVANTATTHVNNVATINNDFDIEAETGENDVKYNTTVGNINLGGAAIGLSVVNTANTGAALVIPGAGPTIVSASGTNTVTGPNSLNSTSVNVANTDTTWVSNVATILNNVKLEAETGENDIENNTSVGNVSTGSVLMNLSFTNSAN